MNPVGVAELKRRLSRYLAVVRSGEDVVITDRGKPVARLTCVADRGMGLPARMLEMERLGEVCIGSGTRPDQATCQRRPRVRAGCSVAQAVADERGEAR